MKVSVLLLKKDMKNLLIQLFLYLSLVYLSLQIPSYYTKANIRGLQVALNAKSFGPASFVRDYVAACVDYGYHRNLVGDFDNESKTVLFVNMGHSYTSCTLARYEKVRDY